jgi:signal transduction histidine kinase
VDELNAAIAQAMNLMKNAIEASDPESSVFVDMSVRKDELILIISNSRPVPIEVREKFFEKFATSGKKGGTGLGTYSAFIMTRAMGGTIDMETSDETGTKVTVRIPISPRNLHLIRA